MSEILGSCKVPGHGPQRSSRMSLLRLVRSEIIAAGVTYDMSNFEPVKSSFMCFFCVTLYNIR